MKCSKEIQSEETRREKQRDLNEEKAWRGSKKSAQIRRRFRRKFERRKPPAFIVVKTYLNANAKFTTYFDTYKTYVYSRVDLVAVFKKALDLTVKKRKLVPGDKIRVIVSHPSWAKPFSTKLITITNDEQFFYILLKSVLEYVEYKAVPLDEVTIEIQSTKIPRGTGRSIKITSDNSGRKRCIITIKNSDTMCLARAIVTAHANINKMKWTASQLKNGFNDSRKLQGTEASKLHEEAGVPVTDYGNTLEHVEKFAHLGIQINIVDAHYFNEIIYTANTDADEIIYVYKNKNHYDVITSMPAFLGKGYYCHTCKKSYTQRDKHRCPLKCLSCFKTEHHTGDKITCDKCKLTFF